MPSFVAGQMGEDSVLDGAKHATIMVTIAYAVFIFLGRVRIVRRYSGRDR